MISVLWRVGKKKESNYIFGRLGIFFCISKPSVRQEVNSLNHGKISLCSTISWSGGAVGGGNPLGGADGSWWWAPAGMDTPHGVFGIPHGIYSKKTPEATQVEGKGLEPGSKPHTPLFPTPPTWILAMSEQIMGNGWCWGINLLWGKLAGTQRVFY